MSKGLKIIFSASMTIASFTFMFISEDIWRNWNLFNIKEEQIYWAGFINRIFAFFIIVIVCSLIWLILAKVRWVYTIRDENYIIEVRYANIFKCKKGIHVINFDECLTTTIGNGSGDIKQSSICGQYLLNNHIDNVEKILLDNNIKWENRKSKYKKKQCLKPGTIIPYKNDMILAFARLDENGIAKFENMKDYMDCLNNMWHELYIKHGDSNVCIPIIGSGKTDFHGKNLSQQEMLDIIISSYKTSDYRLKKPYKLIICCKRDKEFSLNNIGKGL